MSIKSAFVTLAIWMAAFHAPVGMCSAQDFSSAEFLRNLRIPPSFSIDETGGRSGAAALSQDKAPGTPYNFLVLGTMDPEHPRYKFGGWIRFDAQKTPESAKAGFFVQFSGRDGMHRLYYLGGAGDAGRAVADSDEWQYVEGVVDVPSEAVQIEFGVNMPGSEKSSGKYWIDGAFIEPMAMDMATAYVAVRRPLGGRLADDSPTEIQLVSDLHGMAGMDESTFLKRVEVGSGDKMQIFTFEVSAPLICNLNPADLPKDDNIPIRLTLLEKDTGKVRSNVAESSVRRVVLSPDFVVTVDEANRTLVNGRKFMPIGLFMGVENGVDTLDEKHLRLIADSDFNTIKPNTILRSSILKRDRSEAEVVALFDLFEQLDLMCILHVSNLKDFEDDAHRKREINISYNAVEEWQGAAGSNAIVRKLVPLVKNSTALLAYYTGDELPVSWVPDLVEKRLLLRELDPSRPTYGAFCHMNLLRKMRDCYDIIGVDPYPVTRHFQGIDQVENWTQLARLSEWPQWDIPQLHNFGMYNAAPKRYQDDPVRFVEEGYRAPTGEELKAMVLTMALNGSKGFLFYAYNGLLFEAPSLGETFDKRWQDAKDTASLLKRIEPFIMSEQTHQPLNWIRQRPNVRGAELPAGSAGSCFVVVNMHNEKNKVSFGVESNHMPEIISGDAVITAKNAGVFLVEWHPEKVDSLVFIAP